MSALAVSRVYMTAIVAAAVVDVAAIITLVFCCRERMRVRESAGAYRQARLAARV